MPYGVPEGKLWLMLAVGIVISGIVIYTAVRMAIIHAMPIVENERAKEAKAAEIRRQRPGQLGQPHG